VEVALVLLFTDQSKAEMDCVGDGEAEGDKEAKVLVLQVMGVIESSFNTSVAGAVETRLLPFKRLSVTTQERVPPSPDPSTSTKASPSPGPPLSPHSPSYESKFRAEVFLTLAVVLALVWAMHEKYVESEPKKTGRDTETLKWTI
jgi:hypothetical protein